MSHCFNPARLALARRRRGLTLRALAEESGLPASTLSAYENGVRNPPDGVADRIARTLMFPHDFFSRAEPEEVSTDAVSFRALSKLKAKDKARALAGGQLAIELNDWLEHHFILPEPHIPDLRYQRDPESAADEIRVYWRLGTDPIPNMVHLLESKGVRVFSLAERTRQLDAFSFWRGDTPFVFLNTGKSGERSRFDAAHELGHLVMHKHGQPTGRQAEREADQFASALLMSRSSVLGHPPNATIPGMIRAKHTWGVSVSALAYRLRDLEMVSEWQYRQLCIQIQSLGFRTAEPEGMPKEMSQVLEKIFAELRQERVSKARVARILGWPLKELRDLLFQLVLEVVR